MYTRQELKTRPWYRALVVVYIISFGATFVAGMIAAYIITGTKETVVNSRPNPMYLTKAQVQEKVLKANDREEQETIIRDLKRDGYRLEGYADDDNYRETTFSAEKFRFTDWQKTLIFALFAGVVAVAFNLIEKVFLYIAIGQKITFSKKR